MNWMQWLGTHVADWATLFYDLRTPLEVLTFIMSAAAGGLILWLRQQALGEERWARYFGIGFLILAAQYAAGFAFADVQEPAWLAVMLWTVMFPAASLANTLFFVQAGRKLLDSNSRFPRWLGALCIAATFAVPLLKGTGFWWYRFPDTLFSAYCLGLLGYALFTNIDRRRRLGLAILALLGTSLYALVCVGFGFVPLLGQPGTWPALQNGLGNLHPVDSMDTLLAATALPLKLLLFVTAIVVLMRSFLVLSPSKAGQTLQAVSEGRMEFLTSDGILKAIGESFDADLVSICFKLPDRERPQVAGWRWLSPAVSEKDRIEPGDGLRVTDVPSQERSIVGKVLAEGNPIAIPDLEKNPLRNNYLRNVAGMHSLVAVPIFYHGAIIGCLNLEWRSKRGYTATGAQQIERLASYVAPVVQARRQLAALTRWGEQLAMLDLSVSSGEHNVAEIVQKLNGLAHRILSPLATGLVLELGFRQVAVACTDDTSCPLELSESAECRPVSLQEKALELASWSLNAPIIAPRTALMINNVRVGTLVTAVHQPCDRRNRPTLVVDKVHRRTVATLIANALLDAARLELLLILNRLQSCLNSGETNSVAAWFDAISAAAREAGLLWAVVRWENGRLMGVDEDCSQVKHVLDASLNWVDCGGGVSHRALARPQGETRHLLRLTLAGADDAQLWLGVARASFGPELRELLPWGNFLHRFAEAAGATLAAIEVRQLQVELARHLEIAAVSETAGMVVHEFSNLVSAIDGSLTELEDEFPAPIGAGSLPAISVLRRNQQRFEDLLALLRKNADLQGERPCCLRTVVDGLVPLLQVSLEKAQIGLKIDVDASIYVDVPLPLASLALSNLVNNAREAIATDPQRLTKGFYYIAIRARVDGSSVHCCVDDNGPGIPEHLQNNLFEPKLAKKPGHWGWGLPRTFRALQNHKSNLRLASSTSAGSSFEILFPGSERGE